MVDEMLEEEMGRDEGDEGDEEGQDGGPAPRRKSSPDDLGWAD